MKRLLFSLALAGLALAQGTQGVKVTDATGQTVEVRSAARIVALGGGVTEILSSVGAIRQVVGRDVTSYFPAEAVAGIPALGSAVNQSAEAILALKPTVVIANELAGPPAALEQVARAGVPVVRVSDSGGLEGLYQRVRLVSKVAGRAGRGEDLVRFIQRDLLALQARVKQVSGKAKPRVLYLYARPPQFILACGSTSIGGQLVELVGGQNVFGEVKGGQYRGCENLTAEAAVTARPDIILTTFPQGTEPTLEALGVLGFPGIAQTPAGRARRVIAVEPILSSSFTSLSGKALIELFDAVWRQQGFSVIRPKPLLPAAAR